MSLPFETALRATGARVTDAERAPAWVDVSTDTRTLREGQTFLALHGERFDGHRYVAEAAAKGAAALVIDDLAARVAGVPSLVVEDTLRAYMALAAAARERFGGRVVGITGSTGKTTTKALLVQILSTQMRVEAPPGNENNEIGVAKLLLALDAGTDVAVVEMGARKYGDVATLVAMARPNVGILTNVGEAHLEIMGSRERLQETKWGLFCDGARAVLNLDDDVSRARAASLAQPPHWFWAGDGRPPPPPSGTLVALDGSARLTLVDTAGTSRDVAVDARLPGRYNRENLAAALAAAFVLGVPVDAAAAAIPSLALPPGRFERVRAGGVRFIYDAYNASASGTLATLEAFASEPARARFAVLGGMAELGPESAALHERAGEAAGTFVDWLLAGGPYAAHTAAGARRAGLAEQRIVLYATNHDAARWLREHVGHDDLVLLKGSRAYQLEEIVEELASQ